MSTIGTLSPWWIQVEDDAGASVPGALVYYYLTGSSTPATVYHDADLANPWTWPVEADDAGRAIVYLDPSQGMLKLIVTDPDGVQIGLTVDPVPPTNLGTSGLGDVFSFGGNSEAAVTNTSYVSGATFTKLHPGTSVFVADSANLTGTYVITATGVQVTSGTLTVALVDLTSGSPDTPIATAAITSTTGEVATSGAISWGLPGVDRSYGIKPKVSANSGFAWGIKLVRTA